MSAASRAREAARLAAQVAASGKPRNPTASDRRRGQRPLSTEEWAALRQWQAAEVAKLTGTPEAAAERIAAAEFEEEHSGLYIPLESIPLRSPNET